MNIKNKIEALLLAAGSKGVDIMQIKKLFPDIEDTEKVRDYLKDVMKYHLENKESGFLIKNFGNVYHLVTKPEFKEDLSRAAAENPSTALTPASLEVLAIIAYNNPCTIAFVENIRGNNCDNLFKKLTTLGLIETTKRAETPGCPYLYNVTDKFFNVYGIKALSSLPKIETVESFDDSDFFESNRIDED